MFSGCKRKSLSGSHSMLDPEPLQVARKPVTELLKLPRDILILGCNQLWMAVETSKKMS